MSDTDTTTEDTPAEDTLTPPAPEDTETFTRDYVEELRGESAKYRTRAQAAERRLHRALIEADGRLVDPDALPFRAEHLEDPDTLTAAIDALLEDRPYLKVRKPAGNIGQGKSSEPTGPQDFSALLR